MEDFKNQKQNHKAYKDTGKYRPKEEIGNFIHCYWGVETGAAIMDISIK